VVVFVCSSLVVGEVDGFSLGDVNTSTPEARNLSSPGVNSSDVTGISQMPSLSPNLPLLDDVRNKTQDLVDEARSALEKYEDVIAGAGIPIGLLFAFFGLVLLRPALFIVGAALGGTAMYTAIYAVAEDTTEITRLSVVATLMAAVLVGYIAVRLFAIGVVLVGVAAGLALARHFPGIFAPLYPNDSKVAFYLGCALLSLAGGILAFLMERPMVASGTAIAGSFVAVSGVGHFTQAQVPDFIHWNPEQLHHPPDPAYVLGFAILSLAGLLFQLQCSGRHVYFAKESGGRLRRRPIRKLRGPLRRRDWEEMEVDDGRNPLSS